jgi:hypothetical protein
MVPSQSALLTMLLDLLAGQQRAFVRLAARIADESRAAADDRNR